MSFRLYRSSLPCLLILLGTILIVIQLAIRLGKYQQECSSEVRFFEQQRRFSNLTRENQLIIFIGGMPRSGTTLMRAILDSHPKVRCGEETRVIPRILSMRAAWKKSSLEWNRLVAGGISEAIVDSAVRAFIYEVLIQHSQYADVLCDKDPFVLKYASYISSLFSQSKFLLMIRDGRAIIHSMITRNVTVTGFSSSDYRHNLKLWNKGIETMISQCDELGKDRCYQVYYEQLVLQPKRTIENILKFFHLNWVDDVLHHEDLIGKKIALSKLERSTDQVIKPINLEALTRWTASFPVELKSEIDTLAPMLKKLGYDTESDVPIYGTADDVVLENMKDLKVNAAFWKEKAKVYARKSPANQSLFSNQTL